MSATFTFDLRAHPAFHKKLLAIMSEISSTLNMPEQPNVRFYMVGGAPVEYILSENAKPIYDIDGVCLINPSIPNPAFTIMRTLAMEATAAILKRNLEGLTSEDIGLLTKEAGGDAFISDLSGSNYKFSNNVGGTTSIRLPSLSSNSRISEESPLTGIYYYDAALKTHILSVRLRKLLRVYYGKTVRNMPSLLDISFPEREYSGYEDKWAKSAESIILTPEGYPIRSLSVEQLGANLNYAARHTQPWQEEKLARRRNRIARLTAKFPPRVIPTMPTAPPTFRGVPPSGLPIAKATIVKDVGKPLTEVPRTGGASAAPAVRAGGGSATPSQLYREVERTGGASAVAAPVLPGSAAAAAPLPPSYGMSAARPPLPSSAAEAPSTPLPDLTIEVASNGRVILVDHHIRNKFRGKKQFIWFAFEPYSPDGVYLFETGFRGGLGPYWQHPDGRYRPFLPPGRW